MITGRTRRIALAVGGLVGVVALALAAALFQPWQLVVNRQADDALPGAPIPITTSSSPAETAKAPPAAGAPTKSAAPKPKVIRTGRLITHEHQTSGQVKIISLPNGDRVLRFEDLDTSSGPDLRVWLSTAPVVEGRDGWFVFKNRPHVELGKLRANHGDQNYALPADANLDQLRSVSIWCKRFRVSFGAAALS